MRPEAETSGDVFFHSRSDRPYGAFSNFAHFPIVLAGETYATVEHWYQSQRAADPAQRQRIATAATPGEAKALGRGASPERADWPRVRVGVMYRGVLAKFRQHPSLARLLLETGDRALHEDGADIFWAYAGGAGGDWLGRLLIAVREQLRSRQLGRTRDRGLLEALRGSFSVGYQIAAGIRETFDPHGAWFTHFIREEQNGTDPHRVLNDVLRDGEIRPHVLPGGGHGVCFTAAAQTWLRARCFGPERELRRQHGVRVLSGFGVALPYDFGRELGLRPVLSVHTEEVPCLPENLRWLAQPFGSEEQRDWTYEDEWRIDRPVVLRADLMRLVIPRPSAAGQLDGALIRGWQWRALKPNET